MKGRNPSVKKQSRSGGLLEDVRREMADARHGPATWWERIAPEHIDELNAIKKAWLAGELGKRKKTLARSLSENMRARGISDVGLQGVISWLEKA